MSERERLVELMTKAENAELSLLEFEKKMLADYLLASGVIVPPVRVGDTVYEIQQDRTLQKWYVYGIIKYDGQEWATKAKNNKNKWNYIDKTFAFRLSGKTVFLTKKSAEKALKGGAE